MYDEKDITLKIGGAKLVSDKHIANPWGLISYQAEFEIAKEIKRLNDYIIQLEAQISRDRESLIKEGEFAKKYLGDQREWINE